MHPVVYPHTFISAVQCQIEIVFLKSHILRINENNMNQKETAV